MKIAIVAGARPNFVKIAPLIREFKNQKGIKPILIHTGQHYDFKMSEVFFKDLEIPKPDYNLEVGSGSHAYQTGEALIKLEKVILAEKPALVIVVGDANSSLVGALAAAKLHIPVAHVEAGLRSFNKKMPEEINRILTDHIADYLFATEPAAVKNLLNEGISRKKIYFVGNIMIDTLLDSKNKIGSVKSFQKFGLEKNNYALLTLHRQENVGDKKILTNIVDALCEIQNKIPIIWPVHLRTQKQLRAFGLRSRLDKIENIKLGEPLGYLETLSLLSHARFVMTDSGGVQEESTMLKIPCITIRTETERPITVILGTNKVAGVDKKKIINESLKILSGKWKRGRIPKLWDGKTAKRIVKIIKNHR